MDNGPNTPVTINWDLGHNSLKNVKKGMDPPSAIAKALFPKYTWLAELKALSNIGGYSGALNPCPARAFVTVIFAL